MWHASSLISERPKGGGKRGHIVADTNVSPFARACNNCCGTQNLCPRHKNVSDFFQQHFVSATDVSRFALHRNNHEQQCVRNIVSSFGTTLRTGINLYARNVIPSRKIEKYKFSFIMSSTNNQRNFREVHECGYFLLVIVVKLLFHISYAYKTQFNRKSFYVNIICFAFFLTTIAFLFSDSSVCQYF